MFVVEHGRHLIILYMTALLFNDIHASRDNLNEFEKNWDEMLSVCKENGIKHVIIGGDLFQSRASQTLDTLLAVRASIRKAVAMGIKIVLIAGNHDKTDQERYESFNNILEIEKGALCLSPDITKNYLTFHTKSGQPGVFWMLDYYPESGTALDKIKQISDQVKAGDWNVLYCHQGISGALSKPSDKELPVSAFEKFDLVLVGHYHDRCHIKGTNIYYIGASRQHTYGEDEEKGYTIFSDGITKFVKNLVNIRFATVECNLKDVESFTAASRNRKLLDDPLYRVRLRVHAEPDETVDKDKYLAMGYNKVEVVDESIQANQTTEQSLETKYDKGEIKKEYAQFCINEGVDPELGMTYLEKIN